MKQSNTILKVQNLIKTYKNFALKGINLELKKGSVMGFIGVNGAGKSTTLKAIMNMIPIDDGEIIINGLNSIENEIETKKVVGYVGELNLYRDATANNIYKFVKKFYSNWDDIFYKNLIKRLNIDTSKKIKELSKGAGVKFLLALTLAHHPKLLLLDEPTSGLDPVVRDELLDILIKLVKQEECTILFSSHITEDIIQIADQVTYIDNGEILFSDNKNKILNNYKKVNFKETVNSINNVKYFKNNTAIIEDINDFTEKNQILVNDKSISVSPVSLNDILILLTNNGQKEGAV